MSRTKIPLGTMNWPVVTGCSRVDPGCAHCWAERMDYYSLPWLKENAHEIVRTRPSVLSEPLSWKKEQRVLVANMGDLFHPLVPGPFIEEVRKIMAGTKHIYLLLTRWPHRMATIQWPDNVWAGTSIPLRQYLARAEAVRTTTAGKRWLCFEPLLGPVGKLNLDNIDWVVVGGEAGKHLEHLPERVMDHAWAREIRDQVVAAGIPFYFKQSSGAVPGHSAYLREENNVSVTEYQQFPVVEKPVQLSLF
jgi:protein gp37